MLTATAMSSLSRRSPVPWSGAVPFTDHQQRRQFWLASGFLVFALLRCTLDYYGLIDLQARAISGLHWFFSRSDRLLPIVAWQHSTSRIMGCTMFARITVCASLYRSSHFGTLAGSMCVLLRRLGFDPAASSAPFVATLVDVTGLCIYFIVALLILRGTLL